MLKRIFGPMIVILFAAVVPAMAQFAEAPQYATNSPAGKGPSSVAVGDFEGDSSGRDDVAVVDQTGTVSIFLNKRDGSGTFSVPPATYKVTTGATAYLIAAGKFNSSTQSTPDLIVADNLGNVTLLLSNGNGTFQTPTLQFSTPANFSAIVTADLNGDGIGDAVVADSQTATVWVLTGKGGGTFGNANFQTGLNQVSQPVFLALGNVIHSKPTCPDLVAAAQDGTVAILSNSNDQHCSGGSTTFKVALVLPPDPNPNGVGIPAGVTSVYAANYGGWQNTGAPTGVVDIVVASTGLSQLNFNSFPSAFLLWNSTFGGQVSFLFSGTFLGQPTTQGGLTPVSMAGADIDGDGLLDLIIANQSDNSVSVFFGDGIGDLLSSPVTAGPPLVPLEFGSGLGPASIATGTFTAGTSQIGSDLATANQSSNSVSAFVNNGTNSTSWLEFRGARSDYITPAFPVSVATGVVQMNANCQPLPFPDAIVANQSNVSPAEATLFGPFGDFSNDATGDGSFFGYSDDGSGYGIATPYSLVSADFNGDGFGDVALVDSNGLVSVFLDDVTTQPPCSANGFDLAPQAQLLVGAGASSYLLALGKFTNSTQTLSDIVVADGSGKVTVLSNAGGGNFKAQAAVPISASFSSVTAGDLNGDGISDVVAGDSNTGSVWVVPGTGNGGLATPVNVATGLSKGPVFVALAKFHSPNQTLPDLVVAAQNGVIEVLTNTSSGSTISFATPVVISAGVIPAGLTSILAQDFNQDGLADLVVGSTQVWLFFNTTVSGGQPTFAGPTAYVAGNVPVAMAVADFNGDGSPDLAVANSIPNPSTNSNCTTNQNPLNCGSNTMSVLLNTGFFAKVALTASPNPVQFGNPVTLTATVSGSKSTPTGQVTFYDGITQPPINLGSSTLSNGVATLVVTTLTVGSHNITSVYGGDSNYPLAVSNTVLEGVTLTAPILTTVNLTSSPNPSQLGSTVTFTATVTPQSGSGTPTGTVTFYSGGTALGSPAMLNGGVAMLSTASLTLGSNTITAVYSGDNTFAGSVSGPLVQIVTLLPPLLTSVALQSSLNPSEVSEIVTFTATVSAKSSQGTPTGTVQFMDSTTTLGNSTLNSKAVAGFSTTALALGNHNITAVYSGDAQFVASTSPVLIQKVTTLLADFGLAASPGSTTLPAGSSASFTIKGTAQNGFAGTIALSCGSSAMPTGVSCAFFPNSLTIGLDGSPATSTLTIATAAPVSASVRPVKEKSLTTWLYAMGLTLAPALFATILLFVPKRRYLLSFCLSVLLIGELMSQVACGGGSSSTQAANTAAGTPPGSYSVTVVGTTGATQHTTSVTLIVQ
ncbi:MAG TPA: Ig-like domain repeat protein [Terriglobales bacterium]|nr:Ig-like domain repeat protein [Terriglobales bacterium]